jgi:hypothetical protein
MSKYTTYTLTAEGTIPSFVFRGGQFGVPNGGASPQDWTMVGEVDDSAPGDAFTVQALADYLTANDWTGEQTALEAAATFMGDTVTADDEKAAREALAEQRLVNVDKVPVIETAVDELIVAVLA